MWGLSEHIIKELNILFSGNSKIEQVILYGSRAKGNHKEGSDIDLTIKGKDLKFDDLMNLNIKIDNLLLPYKIDLSIYSNIKNSELLDHINRVGISFYEKRDL